MQAYKNIAKTLENIEKLKYFLSSFFTKSKDVFTLETHGFVTPSTNKIMYFATIKTISHLWHEKS